MFFVCLVVSSAYVCVCLKIAFCVLVMVCSKDCHADALSLSQNRHSKGGWLQGVRWCFVCLFCFVFFLSTFMCAYLCLCF